MKKGLGMMMGMMAVAMAGAGGFPIYGMPRMPRGRAQRDPELPPIRHVGEIPKGCRKETECLQFSTDNHIVSVDVDVVFANLKTRAKKLNAIRMAIAYYLRCRYIGDIQKDERFIVEPLITPKDEAAV